MAHSLIKACSVAERHMKSRWLCDILEVTWRHPRWQMAVPNLCYEHAFRVAYPS